jgi:hypothetical protein
VVLVGHRRYMRRRLNGAAAAVAVGVAGCGWSGSAGPRHAWCAGVWRKPPPPGNLSRTRRFGARLLRE